jgi:hypothetical protein
MPRLSGSVSLSTGVTELDTGLAPAIGPVGEPTEA